MFSVFCMFAKKKELLRMRSERGHGQTQPHLEFCSFFRGFSCMLKLFYFSCLFFFVCSWKNLWTLEGSFNIQRYLLSRVKILGKVWRTWNFETFFSRKMAILAKCFESRGNNWRNSLENSWRNFFLWLVAHLCFVKFVVLWVEKIYGEIGAMLSNKKYEFELYEICQTAAKSFHVRVPPA